MKRVLILVENGYEELELWVPYYRFIEAALDVVLVGPETGATYTGKHGLPASAAVAFVDANLDSVRAILIPGGWAPDRLRLHEAAVDLVRRAYDRGIIVAAICHAGSLLVSAGIVRGKRVTSYPSIRDDLVAAGADWVDEPVVLDRCLVTSRTPADLPQFLPVVLSAIA